MIAIVAKSLLNSPFEDLLCEPVSIAVGLAPKADLQLLAKADS
jgi:hypothetical protein